jgi:uncharacterized protein (DUF58 family)
LLVLLTATIMSSLPHSLPALVLLLVMLLATIRPLPPRLTVAINVAVIFLTPLVLTALLDRVTMLPPTAVQIISVIIIFPAIYLLDDNLRQNARYLTTFIKGRTGRHTTYTYLSLLISALVAMLLSPVINNPVLLFSGIAFALYLLGVLIGILFTIPRLPLTTPTIRKRIIAGTTGSVLLDITSQASARLHILFTAAEPWVKVTQERFILNRGKTRLDLSFTPPLAGQSCPQIKISAIDPWGFVQINQLLEPLQLHVIPRAKYAEWLARKYLEQIETGVETAATLPPKAIMMPKRGIEYLDSRTYQPGDQLKDVDWKHTLKLGQLIVKEYIDTGELAAIIAVNLSVTEAEAADKLAFNLITVALTLAQEGIPTALAAYNHQSVILSTAITAPSEILRQALSLVREITRVEFADRHLEPTDIAKIRRNITQLKQAESEPAQRLLGMLNFEYNAIEEATRNNPATIALTAATKRAPAPAVILLVSQLNHDAEAIMATTEKLSKRRFTTVKVD